MKKLILILTLLSCQYSLATTTTNPYLNLREGDSRFITEEIRLELRDFTTSSDMDLVKVRMDELLSDKKTNSCASKIIDGMKKTIPGGKSMAKRKLMILSMRQEGLFDDIVTDALLRLNEIEYKWSPASLRTSNITADKIKAPYQEFSKRRKTGSCVEDLYGRLAYQLSEEGIFKGRSLRNSNKKALKENFITRDDYKALEALRQAKPEKWSISLKDYKLKLMSLRKQAPISEKEESVFVTEKYEKEKLSLRQMMFNNYNYFQILLMGDVINRLRNRFEAKDISIVVTFADDVEEDQEIIHLEPMERFKFALKMLRKELSRLNAMDIFKDRKASYKYLIAAAYEVNKVPSNELTELKSLEEIWNPKRTKMEKIMFWANTFGGVAATVVSSTYGFLPAMALMVIEGMVIREKPDSDVDYNLF